MLKFLNKFNTLILQKVKYSLPMVVLLVLGMFSYWYKSSQIEIDVSCQFETSNCTVLGRETEMVISVSPFPIKVEEMLTFTLVLEPGMQFESAWIQGINMYMGKIPVLPVPELSSGDNTIKLESYLGSCSEPNMRWQMIINLSDITNNQFSRYVNFSTKIN